jgi:hypothetical protein
VATLYFGAIGQLLIRLSHWAETEK